MPKHEPTPTSQSWQRFEDLTQKLLTVPKKELDLKAPRRKGPITKKPVTPRE